MEGVICWPTERNNFLARSGYAVFGGHFIPRVTLCVNTDYRKGWPFPTERLATPLRIEDKFVASFGLCEYVWFLHRLAYSSGRKFLPWLFQLFLWLARAKPEGERSRLHCLLDRRQQLRA